MNIATEILKVLRDDGDSYGLRVIEAVNERTDGEAWLLSGRVYPELRKLEADGLLSSYDSDPISERGFRPRRMYKLTQKGRDVLKEIA